MHRYDGLPVGPGANSNSLHTLLLIALANVQEAFFTLCISLP